MKFKFKKLSEVIGEIFKQAYAEEEGILMSAKFMITPNLFKASTD